MVERVSSCGSPDVLGCSAERRVLCSMRLDAAERVMSGSPAAVSAVTFSGKPLGD